MHTVELLPDPELDSGVRDLWRRLLDAGLPSLATHPHPTNRPHLTMITATTIAGIVPLKLPIAAELGRVRFLGRALVREVVPTANLLDLQTQLWTALAGADPWPAPADWIPHVSLALTVPANRRDAALRMLTELPAAAGHFVAARSYDARTRTVLDL